MNRRERESEQVGHALGVSTTARKALAALMKACGWGSDPRVLSTDARSRIHEAALAYAKACGWRQASRVNALENALRDVLTAADHDPDVTLLVTALGRARDVLEAK